MLYNLFDLIAIGWTPADTVEDPILWHRRCLNEISDYIVNHTTDIKRSWRQRFQPPVEDYDIFRSNLLVHTDGGTRAGEWFCIGLVRGSLYCAIWSRIEVPFGDVWDILGSTSLIIHC